jgi:hypothetical protein
MTDLQLLHAHGTLPLRADLNGNALQIDVEITAVRHVFGRVDVCVTPCKGSGSVWVRLNSLKGITHGKTIEASSSESSAQGEVFTVGARLPANQNGARRRKAGKPRQTATKGSQGDHKGA